MGGFYWVKQRNRPPVVPTDVPAAAAPQPAAAASVTQPGVSAIEHPIEAASAPAQPPLVVGSGDRPDAVIEKALSDLVGRNAVLTLWQTDRLATRVAATVDALPRKQAPSRMWPVHPVPGRFSVEQRGDSTFVAAGNAERYAPLVRMVESVDTAQAVALYVRLYPMFQRAYEELGYPGRHFNDRVVQAIDDLLAAPTIDGPLKVHLREVSGPIRPERPWVMYEAQAPELEALSAGQKIMLRIGESNASRLKAKLRDFRRLIASPRR
jgi:hypothetical protein